jgi:membrane-bound lytic murein transglycosylase D
MFLKLRPLRGHGRLLAMPLAALALNGCANLQSGGTDTPVQPVDAASAAVPTQSPAIVEFRMPVHRSDKFDIESQVAQAELAMRERELAAEAAAVEAILASFEETQRKHDAWLRLQQGMQLTPVDNERVRAQLKWFVEHPGYMQRVMERARPILPFVLDELEKRDLPTELALLPIVESAYQAFAYSHGRASGMWQIIPSTGRFLGLKQNWWYDGRRDIIESTRAAINYLEQLAGEFNGDWELALASYNAGPGRIRGAVRYNRYRNRPTDFWHLTRIRNETRAYVPKMFALKEMFTYPEKYQLDLLPISNQVSYEIVELDGQIDLALAADLAGISVNQLYQLNPAFNRWATAPDGPHRLLLPRGKADHFKHEVAKIPPTQRINWVRHKIRSGETLSQISQRYRTSVSLIKEVNNIRGSHIRAGKYLMVPTATKSLQTYTLSANSRLQTIQNTNRGGTRQEHIVRPGQSLWSISRSYGVSTRALAKWNGMAPIDTLHVGQKLVVWTNPKLTQTVSISQTRPSNTLHALRYTVRKGDSLYLIANRFNISVADIKRWNQVGKYLQPGQKLKLYVDITSQSG